MVFGYCKSAKKLLDMVAQESATYQSIYVYFVIYYYIHGVYTPMTQSVGGYNAMYVRGAYVRGVGNQAYVAPYTSGPGP